jgi:predicted phage tail protein
VTPDSPGIMHAVGDTIARATDLLLLELRVARAELAEKLVGIKTGATSIVVGAILITAALFLLLQAAVIGLIQAAILTPFGASLLVGVAVLAVGVAFVISGKKKLEATSLVPERALTDLKRDGAIVKEKLS